MPNISYMLYYEFGNFSLTKKTRLLGNSFIESQFNYGPLIRMFCRKICCSKIEKIHHETLKVIYNTNESYFSFTLQSNSVAIHRRHSRFFKDWNCKSISLVNPKFMWSYFIHKELPYNLRKESILKLPRINSTCYGPYKCCLITLGELRYGIIFLLLSNPTSH